MNKIFFAWKPFCTRSQNIAYHLGAEIIYIFPFNSDGSTIRTFCRYLVSIFSTLLVLLKKRPNIIFSLNQPPPLISLIFIYSILLKKKFILDSHSAAFNDQKWAWFKPIYKIIARNAYFNINTNKYPTQTNCRIVGGIFIYNCRCSN